MIGSPGRARTADPVINSHLLYQLSYRGTQVRDDTGNFFLLQGHGLILFVLFSLCHWCSLFNPGQRERKVVDDSPI